MSGDQQDPDIMCEVFILDPTDLVEDSQTRGRATRAESRGGLPRESTPAARTT